LRDYSNRTQAQECVRHPVTTSDTVINYDDDAIVYRGTWAESGGFMESAQVTASLKFIFLGSQNVSFVVGTGPDDINVFDNRQRLYSGIDYAPTVSPPAQLLLRKTGGRPVS
jgi:hypothetical protein